MNWRIIAGSILIAAGVILAAWAAAAHDWYPYSCCSSQDCYPLRPGDVTATPDGWLIKATGEVIAYGETRTTPPEGGGLFHRCSLNGDPAARTIGQGYPRKCLWAPDLGH